MAVEITGINTTSPSANKTDASAAPAHKADSQTDIRNGAPVSTTSESLDPALDKVTLTQQAEELRMIEKAISSQTDIDKERIASLKLEIDAGRYDIDAQRVAEKLIEFESLFVA